MEFFIVTVMKTPNLTQSHNVSSTALIIWNQNIFIVYYIAIEYRYCWLVLSAVRFVPATDEYQYLYGIKKS
jgi:hypothetical protein